MLFGATGTIGRATAKALVARGHDVVCFVRPRLEGLSGAGRPTIDGLADVTVRFGDVTDPASVAAECFRGERFDAVVSCLASRTGTAKDAWAIDHRAHVHLLTAAKEAGVSQFVLLSALCVPRRAPCPGGGRGCPT